MGHLLESLHFLDQVHYFSYTESALLKEVKTESNPLKKGICLDYSKTQALTQRTYPNHTQTNYSYDDTDALIMLEEKRESKETYKELHYKRDKLGRVSRMDLIDKAQKTEADPIDFIYNERKELIEISIAHDANPTTFSYNSAGNRISAKEKAKSSEYSYNIRNHLTEDDAYIYNYDERGNLRVKVSKANKRTTLYTFNLFDQLTQVKVYKSTQQQYLLEQYDYSYDALNRRVEKSYLSTQETHFDKLSDLASKQSYSHHYLYENNNIIAILNQNQDLLATLVHADTIDTPLSIQNERTGERYYYHADHQGSITHLTNEDGDIVETFTYDNAYGTILEHTKEEETYNPYCYTAREFDSKELYYYRARYYDPTLGRFISKDPIEFMAGDFNFYRYVGNDPVNYTDPSGLEADCTVYTAAGAAVGAATGGGVSVACDVASGGLCLVINAPILAATTAIGGLLGNASCEMSNALGNIFDDLTWDMADTEAPSTTGSRGVVIEEAQTSVAPAPNDPCKNSNKNKGNCAEELVNKEYEKNGWERFDTKRLENKSGHGIDNILTKGNDVSIIETKANTAGLNAGQRLGGQKYLDKQLTEMIRGFKKRKGRWASYKDNKELGKAIKDLKKILKGKNPNFRICRVKLEEDPMGCYGANGKGKCKGEVNCDKPW